MARILMLSRPWHISVITPSSGRSLVQIRLASHSPNRGQSQAHQDLADRLEAAMSVKGSKGLQTAWDLFKTSVALPASMNELSNPSVGRSARGEQWTLIPHRAYRLAFISGGCLGKISEIQQLRKCLQRLSRIEHNYIDEWTLLAYAKAGEVKLMEQLFSEICARNARFPGAWRIMISGLIRNARFKDAMRYCRLDIVICRRLGSL